MSDVAEIQIIRADCNECEESSLGCYVSSNNKLLEVVTPISPHQDDNRVELRRNSNLRLIIKTMGETDEYVGSVTLSANLLPPQGYVWLPLLPDMEFDCLDSIPETTEPPRILLSVTPSSCVLNELLSVDSSFANAEKLRAPQKVKRSNLEIAELKGVIEAASFREASILALLEQKDQELAELSSERAMYCHEYCQSEMSALNERISELTLELQQEKQRAEKSYSELLAENHLLQEQLPRKNPVETRQSAAELDAAVEKSAKALGVSQKLLKINDHQYIYEGNKLSLTLEKGNLMVRIGGGSISFCNYVNLSLPHSIQDWDRSTARTIQNYISPKGTESAKTPTPYRHRRGSTAGAALENEENLSGKRCLWKGTNSSDSKAKSIKRDRKGLSRPFK